MKTIFTDSVKIALVTALTFVFSISSAVSQTDTIPPTPYCIGTSTAFISGGGSIELWACDFVIGSEDNVTLEDDMRYTFTGPNSDGRFPDIELGATNCESRIYTCNDICEESNVILVGLYVWDESDNYNCCFFTLSLVNCGGWNPGTGCSNISGMTLSNSSVPITEVTFNLSAIEHDFSIYDLSDEFGDYQFNNIETEIDYQISAEKDDELSRFVDINDLDILSNHLDGSEMFDNPYQYISADLDGNNSVDQSDLELLKSIFDQEIDTLNNMRDWRFHLKSFPWTLDDPFTIVESLNVGSPKDTIIDNLDFIGIKIGDIDGSYTNITSSIVDQSKNDKFWVSDNFPNPFRNTTAFRIHLPYAGEITLKVYDQLGKFIRSESFELMNNETQIFPLDTNGLKPNTQYICQFTFGNLTTSKRVLVIK